MLQAVPLAVDSGWRLEALLAWLSVVAAVFALCSQLVGCKMAGNAARASAEATLVDLRRRLWQFYVQDAAAAMVGIAGLLLVA